MKRTTQIVLLIFMLFVILYIGFILLPPDTQSIVLLILTLLNILISFYILSSKKRNDSKISWILVILFLPFLGLFFYLLFGINYLSTKKFLGKQKMDNILLKPWKETTSFPVGFKSKLKDELDFIKLIDNLTDSPIHFNTATEVLTNGDRKFEKLINELKSAEKFIHMEYYIIHEGKIADKIKEILFEKAKEGLEIRILMDGVGCLDISRHFLNEMRENNIKIEFFNPLSIYLFQDAINYRNHRKIVVIDGKKAFVGGINIGDEYAHLDSYYGFWRDTHLYLEGDAVRSLHLIFIQDWFFTTGESLLSGFYLPNYKVKLPHKEGVQIIADGPDNGKTIIKDVFFKALNEAKERIIIATPYLVPDYDILKAIQIASLSGIEVKIILPGKPDKRIVYYCTQSYFDDFLNAGCEIYLYKDTFMHSKVLIVDDKIASVGTANLDLRSFHTNFEVTVLLYLSESINNLVRDVMEDLQNSTKIDKAEWDRRKPYQRWFEAFAKLFSPML